jgi:hypothetical protein
MGIKEITIIFILDSSMLFVGLGIPFYVVLFSGNWLRGIFLSWSLLFLSFVIISGPLAALVATYDKYLALDCFPEGIGAMPILFFGWFPAIIVTSVAMVVREIFFLSSSKDEKENKD